MRWPHWTTLLAVACAGCGGWHNTDVPAETGGEGGAPSVCSVEIDSVVPVAAPMGLRVEGNRIVDAAGEPVILRGVNRSGSEYLCIGANGFFEGHGLGADAEASVRAMASWNVNAVRVPLNESCWLAVGGAPQGFSGETYRAAIRDYVALLQRYGLIPILELHWAAPGDLPANRQQPMPNMDHTPDFWTDVAETFMENSGVIFEVYNEPYPDSNRDSVEGWECWRDGCEITRSGIRPEDVAPRTYLAAGMQSLVDAIRATGSTHVVLLGGLQFSNALSGWLTYVPNDPLRQLGAAWHVYNFNACDDATCWNGFPADVAAAFPLVATEVGQDDCEGEEFLRPLLEFLDAQGSGYLAWSWNAYGACEPGNRPEDEGQPWSLVTADDCPEPNSNYARAFHHHLQGAVP
jgi:endoglucanase